MFQNSQLLDGSDNAMERLLWSADSASDFLRKVLELRSHKNPSFGLRAWAKKLGLSSHGVLSHVVSGNRPVSEALLDRLCIDLHLRGKSQKYFQALVVVEHARTPTERALLLDLLSHLRPSHDRSVHQLSLDRVDMISSWEHTAILELVRRTDFSPTEKNLCQALGSKVSAAEVHQALGRLLRLGMLEKHRDGSFKRSTRVVSTPTDVPSDAIRKFHASMLEKAKEALVEQSVERREFQSLTLSLSEKDIPKLKARIRDFVDELEEEFSSEVRNCTYHIQCQAFLLSQGLSPQTSVAVSKRASVQQKTKSLPKKEENKS